MTPEMRRLVALVSLNGAAKDLCDDFARGTSAVENDITVLMRQIGDQIALAVGMLVKQRAERQAKVEAFEVES